MARLGKRERLAALYRASKVNDNLHISLRDVKQSSDIASPMSVATLQSKGARGGFAPYGRTERFVTKQPANPKRFGQR